MGIDLCWIGVPADECARLLDWFDFEVAGEVSDEISADFTLAQTPAGWTVLAARSQGFVLDEALAGLSSPRRIAVGGEVIDSVSMSRTVALRDGRRLWSVSYNGEVPGGLNTEGDLPDQFQALMDIRKAQQASAPADASFLFNLPADLAAAVAGYRPSADDGLEWTVLRKRTPKAERPARRPQSLRAAMYSELVPLLRSLGWETSDRPALADLGQIRRTIDGVEQTIWFEYASGQETYVIVHLFARRCIGGPEFAVRGRVVTSQIRLPIWKRFTWKRLAELTRYEPPPDDLVTAVLDRACDEIRVADEYLRSWAPNSRIAIDFARPSVDWPSP